MVKSHVTLTGPEDVIRQLALEEMPEGVKLGRSQPADGFADAANAPLGPDEIRQLLELVSVVISTGTAAVALFEKLRALLKPGQQVTVKDARNGQTLATVNPSTPAQQVAAKVVPDDGPGT